jgi:coniferyl-aldehyde dehydrogenase
MNEAAPLDSPYREHARGDDLEALLSAQRSAFLAEGPPSVEVRRLRIDRLIELLLTECKPLIQAMSTDFGHRAPMHSLLTDAAGLVPSLMQLRSRMARWMKPERRSSGFLALFGARAWVEWQPLGIVGVIAPWNFPVALALQPVAQAFAAGNRAMLKLSEYTPRTAQLLQRAIAGRFDPSELVAVTGDAGVGARFSRLPFDHLFFTGATHIGCHVMRAAADNLVPVTLELGGKSPVVIGTDADLATAATRIALGKILNAGQICLAPDYVFLPQGREQEFVNHFRNAIGTMLPSLRDNEDYTAILNERHRQRLRSYLDEASALGANVVEINPAGEMLTGSGKMAPTLVLGVTDAMKIMQEEIFGPLLPLLPYRSIDEAIGQINARPRPLGAYYFGGDTPERRRFLQRTLSGGVTFNDIMAHCGNESLPFGGVGASGMGCYHGIDGFRTFSHGRAVQTSAIFSINAMLAPPFGRNFRRVAEWLIDRERRKALKRIDVRASRSVIG